jgi:hypothetical protein
LRQSAKNAEIDPAGLNWKNDKTVIISNIDLLGLGAYTIDWQHLLCLLYALHSRGGISRRSEAVEYIRNNDLLALNHEDMVPYLSQKEPSWMTDIAYARKIGVIMGIINDHERNSWEINREGIKELRRIQEAGDKGLVDARRCFLWSTKLRRLFDPDYSSSSQDSPRPPKRSNPPSVHFCLSVVEEIIKQAGEAGMEKAAQKLTRTLGFRVHPSRQSLAYAIHLNEELQKPKELKLRV